MVVVDRVPNGIEALLTNDAGTTLKGAETLVVVVVDATAKGLDAVVLVLEADVTLLALDTPDVRPPNGKPLDDKGVALLLKVKLPKLGPVPNPLPELTGRTVGDTVD